jgi:hypothetical protein
MPATLLHVDSRKRVTLPLEARVDSGEDLELEVLEDGRLVLTPIIRVPKHQLWLHDPEIDRMLKDYLTDTSPLIDLSQPGNLAAVRAEMKAKRNKNNN